MAITQAGYHINAPHRKSLLCRAVDLNTKLLNAGNLKQAQTEITGLGTTEIEHSMKENINQVSMKWWSHHNEM
jgi:hypothetical protein